MKTFSYRSIDKNVLQHVFFVIIIIALGYLEFRLIWFIQKYDIETVINETLKPLSGNAYWRAYQNRLLAGYALQWTTEFFGWYHAKSFQLIGIVLMAATNVAAYGLFFAQQRTAHAAFRSVLSFALLVLLFQHSGYLYGWDLFDLFFFTLLCVGIAQKRGTVFYTVLFAAAILNRESALFIPVWMGIDALFDAEKEKRSVWKAIYAAVLLGAGITLVVVLRESLFLGSHIATVGMDENHREIGNHLYFMENVKLLFLVPVVIDVFDYAVFAVIGFFLWILIRQWREATIDQLKVLLLIVIMMTVTFMFSLIHETRVWLILIPMIMMYHISFNAPLTNR